MAKLFPSKVADLRDLLYWMMAELFEEEEPCEDAIRIVNKMLQHLPSCHSLFMDPPFDDRPEASRYFDSTFSDYLVRFLGVVSGRRNCNWLRVVLGVIKESCEWFAPEFVEGTLLPKLYGCLRGKTASLEVVV